MIDCDLWPMNILTKPKGSKDRVLRVHPKYAVERKYLKRVDGKNTITTPEKITIPNGEYFLEMKDQGHRQLYCKDAKGNEFIYGRRLNVKGTYASILEKCLGMPLPNIPNETVIDFELVYPGHPDSEVVCAMKGGRDNCPEKLRMKAFSVPIYKGEFLIEENSLAYRKGRKLLKDTVGRENVGIGYAPINLTDENKAQRLEWLMRKAEELGIEGFVLKGMACDRWYKLKGIYEADVFITGFKISTAETRMNMVTGVNFAVYDSDEKIVSMGKCAGFNLGDMLKMTDSISKYGVCDKNPYMNRTIRVVYQEMSSGNQLKHGFFDGWRDDKGSESCTLEQFGV